MNPGFITGIFCRQTSMSVLLTALENFCTDVFFGLFCVR